jgi:hypothetical protein
VWNILAHRPAGAAALAEALAEEPDFVAAHALRGFAGVTLARSETIEAAHDDFSRAHTLLHRAGGTRSERALVEALGRAVEGRLLDAAACLDMHLQDSPRDLLAFKLSHSLRFLSGDTGGMLASTQAVLPFWSRAADGYGFVLGCHAFALEENGDMRSAESFGRNAVMCEPCDAWGAHAVGHVFEMQNRTHDGVRWLEDTRPVWTACNNFSFHMAWHLALCHISQDRADMALALYDTHVRPQPTDDFRDVANAVSLLWRLRQENVDVGDRWSELATLARRRACDTSLVFASLHHLLTLVAVGDAAHARKLIAELISRALAPTNDQGPVAREIGVDLAQTLAAPLLGRAASSSGAPALDRLGGSRAQRDVFLRALALLAAEAGDAARMSAILPMRGRSGEDRFERLARGRLSAALMQRQVA